jgi:hypothetical protein
MELLGHSTETKIVAVIVARVLTPSNCPEICPGYSGLPYPLTPAQSVEDGVRAGRAVVFGVLCELWPQPKRKLPLQIVAMVSIAERTEPRLPEQGDGASPHGTCARMLANAGLGWCHRGGTGVAWPAEMLQPKCVAHCPQPLFMVVTDGLPGKSRLKASMRGCRSPFVGCHAT